MWCWGYKVSLVIASIDSVWLLTEHFSTTREGPLQYRLWMWLIDDDAAPYSSIVVRTFLNWKRLKWWMVWGGPVAWAARSCDLKPLYLYLWDHLRSTVYASVANDMAELQQRVEDRRVLIYNTTGIRERVRRPWMWCAVTLWGDEGSLWASFVILLLLFAVTTIFCNVSIGDL